MDVRRSNRIQKYRNHNSVVDRMTNVDTTSEITPVEPVSPITNNPDLVSYNSLLASDEFYDKLARLQREYKRFYHDQQELERALTDMSKNKESLVENMKELVEKYNTALYSLKKFDLNFNTQHRKHIENILSEFKDNLQAVGVEIEDSAILTFNEYKFKKSIVESNDALRFLFRPIKGLIKRLHKSFKNIKIPKEDDELYYEYGNLNYNGMITDKKI